jgi:PAS domain-containing protein
MKSLVRILERWRTGQGRRPSMAGTSGTSQQRRIDPLLEIAIESAPNGLCIFDADLRVIVGNSHFAAMYGLTPAETRAGTPLSEILGCRVAVSCCPADQTEYVADCLGKARSRETSHTTYELESGNVITVDRHPMLNGGLIEIHRDITDARLAEIDAEVARQELIEKQYAIDQAVIVAVTDMKAASLMPTTSSARSAAIPGRNFWDRITAS